MSYIQSVRIKNRTIKAKCQRFALYARNCTVLIRDHMDFAHKVRYVGMCDAVGD